MSLHLSHLILNPNLYPQLLLGYNQSTDFSDTLSCTSGYSMYTNEGSTFSGFNNQNAQNDNIIHNLQQNTRANNTLQNIVNSNQMINNYTSQTTQPNTNQPNMNTSPNNYNIQSSSNELPFIQRLHNSMHHGSNINNPNLNNFEGFPKVNLQVPSMLSPGEVAMINGISPYAEPNIDIYVHTLVAPSNIQLNQSNSTNTANNIINANYPGQSPNNHLNNINQNPLLNLGSNRNNLSSTSSRSSTINSHSLNQNINNTHNNDSGSTNQTQNLNTNLRQTGQNTENTNTSAENSNSGNSGGGVINNLLENLVNIFTGMFKLMYRDLFFTSSRKQQQRYKYSFSESN